MAKLSNNQSCNFLEICICFGGGGPKITKDTQIRQSFSPNIWLKLVGHISDWIFVAPIDIGSALLVDMQPYGCFIVLH